MKANKAIIIIISILVPMLVAFLFVNTEEQALVSDWIYRLPHLNALINGSTAVILILGVWFIKNGNEKYHKTAMLTAFMLGTVFLVSYIIYHSSVPSTVFGDINHDNELDTSELAMLGESAAYLPHSFTFSHLNGNSGLAICAVGSLLCRNKQSCQASKDSTLYFSCMAVCCHKRSTGVFHD